MAWAHTNGRSGQGSDPLTIAAFANPLTPGSVIVVNIFCSSLPNTWQITDTAGNVYVDCGAGLIAWQASAFGWQTFIALNTHNTAANQITMTNLTGGGSGVCIILADEFTGNASSNVVDGFSSHPNGTGNGGATNNCDSGILHPTIDGDLIVAGFGMVSGNFSVGTGFTMGQTSSGGEGSEYLVQAVHANITPTATDSNSSEAYGSIAVALKPSVTQLGIPIVSSVHADEDGFVWGGTDGMGY